MNVVVREFESDKEKMSVGPTNKPISFLYSKNWTFYFIPRVNKTAEELENKVGSSIIDKISRKISKGISEFVNKNFITQGNLFNSMLNINGYNIIHLDSLMPFKNPDERNKRISWLKKQYNKEIFGKHYTRNYRALIEKLFAAGNIKNISVKDEIDVRVYQEDEEYFQNKIEVDGLRMLSFEFGGRLYNINFDERVFFNLTFDDKGMISGVVESNYNDMEVHGGLSILSSTNENLDPSELFDRFLENYNDSNKDVKMVPMDEFFHLIGRELHKQEIINKNPVRPPHLIDDMER